MKSQSAIFVDAEFLLAVGGAQIAGTSLGSAFSVDSEKLLREKAGDLLAGAKAVLSLR
jgi:hypothetical protein